MAWDCKTELEYAGKGERRSRVKSLVHMRRERSGNLPFDESGSVVF